MTELYFALLQHKEGMELLEEVPKTSKERAEALIKAGIAHVEAGEYEEAKRCFAKARKLENPNRITYESQKEIEARILNEINPNLRDLTPEEEGKAAEAKKRIKTLLPEEEDKEEAGDFRESEYTIEQIIIIIKFIEYQI